MHGDYRIDNCLLARQMPPTVAAVLDWELATLGEPLADLGLFLFYWREPSDPRPAMTPAPSMLPGFPPRSYLAERYTKRTGADLSDLTSWIALAHFKSAVIAQGIAARVQAGSMAGAGVRGYRWRGRPDRRRGPRPAHRKERETGRLAAFAVSYGARNAGAHSSVVEHSPYKRGVRRFKSYCAH